MKTLDLIQGSEEWHQARSIHMCASEASAMMGASKYKSRKQLLQEKKTGNRETVTDSKQFIFDKGHEAEAKQRDIIEVSTAEEYKPAVGSLVVDGVNLLASLDGLSEDGKVIFEHKLFSATLADNVKNKVLEPSHYWQLEQQMIVFDASEVLFVCSDGTEEKREMMTYVSVPARRKKLIAGWKLFMKDLAEFEVEAKQEAVVGTKAATFPLVTYKIDGSMINSNIKDILPIIKERAEIEMNRTLDTDQDFADKENINKATVAAREALKVVVEKAKGEFVSFSEFADIAEQIDSVLQKMQSQGEKQVKQAKEKKKQSIKDAGEKTLMDYAAECDAKISPLSFSKITGMSMPDFDQAMKGKRNLDSITDAVESLVASQKIEIDQVMSCIVPNQIYLRAHAKDYVFLFADVSSIINQDVEPFQAIVKFRISEHKETAEKKVKADALIKSWEDAKKLSSESNEIHIVNDEFLFIKQSKCDKDIFGDSYATALGIYQGCFAAIESNLEALKKGAEETPEVPEPVKEEQPAMEVPTTEKVSKAASAAPEETKASEPIAAPAKESKSTLLGDLEEWATEYNIATEATDALNAILMRHCS